ncbi:hypothetical protein DPEC_G00159410 [Dallia pectoralis]|uniref:Uncharacterized protein n=1 Tax=Dallia pectoralis TaxID=75939 RepID=A0ACC2GFY0_DALPE|nr:hypothetical protein DPEC_G00159410 [Dallia pectoralis]
MAAKVPPPRISKADLLCPLCNEVFNLPVQLKCSHNFCKTCLHNRWERQGSRECPMCRTRSLSVRPPINLALKIAADTFTEQRATRDGDVEERCRFHDEKLSLFCQKDEEPICLICQASKEHKIHECWTLEEAAIEKKMEFSSKLDSLLKHLKKLNRTKAEWGETKGFLKSQADQTEQQMRAEFERLHHFLREEEERRVAKLRQEEKTKTSVMAEKLENIEDMITTLTDTISEVEMAIRAIDVKFLQDYKELKKRTKGAVREPECIRGILIDAARHLGSLKWALWREMGDRVLWVPITLDPNTAQSNLNFSEEFTRVRYGSKTVLPNNPERFTSRMAVLGLTGFSSGRHSWTVEVGQSRDWDIGVVRESVKRKSTIFVNPAEGFWVIGMCNGETYWAQTSPRTRLQVRKEKRPWRITVELDYDRGKVSFLNALDSTVIHVFREKFNEKIFPYFSPGLCADDKASSQLAICPMTVSVEVLDHVKVP